MAWLYLLTAGALEIAATTVFRYTDGMSRVAPTVAFFAIGIASFYFLNRSLEGVPLGTAYAVWSGIGVAGAVLVGILLYDEPAGAFRLLFLATLLVSIVGLKLSTST